ncbi:MAG TPA: hypothetical protein VFC82_06475 [Actinomycetaceae bacterium]|nr:hypothetical protein [Actinomycetaceae bacterium]
MTAMTAVTVRPISPLGRIGSEFRKLVDFRSARILFLAALVLQVLFGILIYFTSPVEARSMMIAASAPLVPLIFLVPIMGVLFAVDEWRQKTVMITYVQDSNRTAVFVAKLIAGSLLALALGAAGMILGTVIGIIGGSDIGDLGTLPGTLAPIALSLVLHLLLGAAVGGATLSVVFGIVMVLVVGQLLPQLLGSIEAVAWLAPYVNFMEPLSLMLNGQWPEDPGPALVALTLWMVIPLGIAIWRNGTKDIS